MAFRETVVSADDMALLSALVEHSRQRTDDRHRLPRTGAAHGIARSAAAAMNTRVEFEDLGSGVREAVWLVHPGRVDAGAGRISVLSPVGRALLGKCAGDDVEVRLPSGDSRELTVLAVREEDWR